MNPASHVAQLLEQSPELATAVSKAAECSVPLLQQALEDYGLLSAMQWAEIAACAEVPGTWLGSGEAWHPHMVDALQRNCRAKAPAPELQRIRRRNLRRLSDSCKATTHLAALLNTAPSMLSDLMNSESRSPDKRRAFGPRRARAFEVSLGLPDGWMDRDEPVPDTLGARAIQAQSGARMRSAAQAEANQTAPANFATPWSPFSHVAPLHQTVLSKYLGLAQAGALDEAFAYGFLGTLLERERQAASAKAP